VSTHRVAVLLVTLLCCLALVGITLAQESSNYKLSWSMVGGGGGASQSANYRLGGSIGQGLAGAAAGNQYLVGAGFWYGVSAHYLVYLPVVTRQ